MLEALQKAYGDFQPEVPEFALKASSGCCRSASGYSCGNSQPYLGFLQDLAKRLIFESWSSSSVSVIILHSHLALSSAVQVLLRLDGLHERPTEAQC